MAHVAMMQASKTECERKLGVIYFSTFMSDSCATWNNDLGAGSCHAVYRFGMPRTPTASTQINPIQVHPS
jgi:hypothetical protein